VPLQRHLHRLRHALPQPRRPLNICKQERDRPGRQVRLRGLDQPTAGRFATGRSAAPAGHASRANLSWQSPAASTAETAPGKTAKKLSPSPREVTTTPPCPSITPVRSRLCRSGATSIASGTVSHNRVDPSISVSKNVPVPAGSSSNVRQPASLSRPRPLILPTGQTRLAAHTQAGKWAQAGPMACLVSLAPAQISLFRAPAASPLAGGRRRTDRRCGAQGAKRRW